jgi:hypothetical protein
MLPESSVFRQQRFSCWVEFSFAMEGIVTSSFTIAARHAAAFGRKSSSPVAAEIGARPIQS